MFQFCISRNYDFFICHICFERFLEKSCRKHTPKANNPKYPLHAKNAFKNKIF